MVNRKGSKDLKTMTIQITINDIKHDEAEENKNGNDEVGIWLKDMAKLPVYSELFKEHGVDDMTVKVLTISILLKMGIDKLGRIAILNRIEQD